MCVRFSTLFESTLAKDVSMEVLNEVMDSKDKTSSDSVSEERSEELSLAGGERRAVGEEVTKSSPGPDKTRVGPVGEDNKVLGPELVEVGETEPLEEIEAE